MPKALTNRAGGIISLHTPVSLPVFIINPLSKDLQTSYSDKFLLLRVNYVFVLDTFLEAGLNGSSTSRFLNSSGMSIKSRLYLARKSLTIKSETGAFPFYVLAATYFTSL